MFRKHAIKKWEISIIEFQTDEGKRYKVTRRLPEVSVADTRFFASKKKAQEQVNSWLG
mgnify:CR=1 FL=1|tara:strand:+ start:273 stop:446 length:174 start_codon:yes stop_codon:yes gene_type:complete